MRSERPSSTRRVEEWDAEGSVRRRPGVRPSPGRGRTARDGRCRPRTKPRGEDSDASRTPARWPSLAPVRSLSSGCSDSPRRPARSTTLAGAAEVLQAFTLRWRLVRSITSRPRRDERSFRRRAGRPSSNGPGRCRRPVLQMQYEPGRTPRGPGEGRRSPSTRMGRRAVIGFMVLMEHQYRHGSTECGAGHTHVGNHPDSTPRLWTPRPITSLVPGPPPMPTDDRTVDERPEAARRYVGTARGAGGAAESVRIRRSGAPRRSAWRGCCWRRGRPSSASAARWRR